MVAATWFFAVAHLYRHPNCPIRKYDVCKRWKKFYAAPLTITSQIPHLLALEKLQVIRVWVMEKILRLRRCNRFHHCRHCHATPVPPPRQVTIYFRCIFRDALFVTLWFSNLVPYVAILKTFHVKKWRKFIRKFEEVFEKITWYLGKNFRKENFKNFNEIYEKMC